MRKKRPKAVKPGKVQRIIKPAHRNDVEKAEIIINDSDHLYQEIGIENTLRDEKDQPVKLKPGADVDVVVEAEVDATVPKDVKQHGTRQIGSMMRFLNHNQVKVDFVQVELTLADTFCRLAESWPNKRSHYVHIARTAYDSATRFMFRAAMNNTELETFSGRLEQVRLALENLES